MSPQEQQFYTLLQNQAIQAKAVLDALQTEGRLLQKLDVEALNANTQVKIECIQALEKAATECINWLKKSSPREQITVKIRDYIQQLYPDNRDMLALLDQIKSLAEQCQRQNQVNGGVIALSQQYTQRALAILHGDTPGAKLYGKQGRAHQSYTPKSLGKV